MLFLNHDREVFGSLRGSKKGKVNIAAVLGLGEAVGQVPINLMRWGGEAITLFFLDEE